MAQWSLTNSSALFKTKFGKLSENAYNSANVLLGTVKKSYDFVGEDMKVATPTFFSGGIGSGVLPVANPASARKATLTAKKVYAVTEIQREAIKASSSSEGAFVDGMKWNVQKTVEAYNRNASRILFGDGTGALGSFSGNATGTATDPILTITAATWVTGHWEENDYVNVNTLGSVFAVVAVNPATRVITLQRVSGSDDLTAIGAGTHIVYLQNSRNNDPMGLKGIADATLGVTNLYGITAARRWAMQTVAAGGAGISEDIMNEVVIKIQEACGKAPKVIVTSYTQYRKILNFLEDHKIYEVGPRAAELKGKISFKGLSYITDAGEIGIFPDRMCPADRLYALNTDFIHIHHRPDFGWFDDDGTVFLRQANDDAYGARYGGYYENYIIPSFHGAVTGLAL
jgi:hypothetical protein